MGCYGAQSGSTTVVVVVVVVVVVHGQTGDSHLIYICTSSLLVSSFSSLSYVFRIVYGVRCTRTCIRIVPPSADLTVNLPNLYLRTTLEDPENTYAFDVKYPWPCSCLLVSRGIFILLLVGSLSSFFYRPATAIEH